MAHYGSWSIFLQPPKLIRRNKRRVPRRHPPYLFGIQDRIRPRDGILIVQQGMEHLIEKTLRTETPLAPLLLWNPVLVGRRMDGLHWPVNRAAAESPLRLFRSSQKLLCSRDDSNFKFCITADFSTIARNYASFFLEILFGREDRCHPTRAAPRTGCKHRNHPRQQSSSRSQPSRCGRHRNQSPPASPQPWLSKPEFDPVNSSQNGGASTFTVLGSIQCH